MSASISLHHLSYATPDGQPLFSDLNLSFGTGRTGLIGRNGTGKSRLLRLISGALQPNAGSISCTGTLGSLDQSVQVDPTTTLAHQLGVRDALQRLDRLDAGAGTASDMAEADWTLPSRIAAALNDVHLPPLDPHRPLATLSGGQRTRLALAKLILTQPDIILLDEPTNNLDAEGRAAIGELLRRWHGTAIVVSHDRALLRAMGAIVELTTLGATLYGGNWDFYSARKATELAVAEHGLASAERKIGEIDRRIQAQAERKSRKDAAGARKGARGDIPKILLGGRKDNAEQTSGENARLANRLRSQAAEAASAARAQVEILTPFSLALAPSGLPAGRTVLQANAVTGGPDPAAPIIRDLSLTIIGPERVAITGPNGSGKTTLLRLLTGALRPVAGSVRRLGRQVMLDQSVSLLDSALSIRDNFRALNPDVDENSVRTALARFMFRADAALQVVGTLSGGEMLRAGLAATIGGTHPPELLILDEPTNHLDTHAIEVIEAGLRAYDGALLVVSHDQDFLAAIGIERVIGDGIAAAVCRVVARQVPSP